MVELGKYLVSREEMDMVFPSNPINMDRLDRLITKLQNLRDDEVQKLESAREEVQYIVTRTDQIMSKIDPGSSQYTSTLRRLQALCRYTKYLPDACYIGEDIIRDSTPKFSSGFSDVYFGRLREKDVAVKVIRVNKENMNNITKTTMCEVITWRWLKHPNVVSFLGIQWTERLHLISPWMVNGTVTGYLKLHPEHSRLHLIKDMLQGVMYIHSCGLVHGDLKAANVLVDASGRACVADFGLTAVVTSSVMFTSIESLKGTIRWMSPELIEAEDGISSDPTTASDIYAVGMTMYEIFTGKVPLFNLTRDASVINAILRGHRPDRPANSEASELSDLLWQTMECCWTNSVQERPELQQLLEKVTNQPSPSPRVLEINQGLGTAGRPIFSPSGERPDEVPGSDSLMQILLSGIALHKIESHSNTSGASGNDPGAIQLKIGNNPISNRKKDMLAESISIQREILGLRPHGHPDRDSSLFDLALALLKDYEHSGDRNALKESIRLNREAVTLRPHGHPRRGVLLYNLAIGLRGDHKISGNRDALEESIQLDREALVLRPRGHPGHDSSLENLAIGLRRDYDHSKNINVLDESIRLDREALALRPHGHPRRSMSLCNLAIGLREHHKNSGNRDALEESIRLDREVLALRPHGHPQRDNSLENLAVGLSRHYAHSENRDLLEEGIRLDREALALRPHGHPRRGISLYNLAIGLRRVHKISDNRHALEESIRLDREALVLRPRGHPGHDSSLENLAVGLRRDYDHGKNRDVLDESIRLDREALALRPYGHPRRDESLQNLANGLRRDYDHSKNRDVLDESIRLYREVLATRPHGHPYRDASLYGLALALWRDYKLSGNRDVLEESIRLDRKALSLRPHGHLYRDSSLHNLAFSLGTDYQHTSNIDALEESIHLYREALTLRPHGHPQRDSSLENLAVGLERDYRNSGNMDTLEESISLYREALVLRPHGHPRRASLLENLTKVLNNLQTH